MDHVRQERSIRAVVAGAEAGYMAEPLDPDRDARSPFARFERLGRGSQRGRPRHRRAGSVWRDDLLLDAIGAAARGSDRPDVPFDVSADRRLIEALLKWRRDVESDPVESDPPAPVGPDLVRDTPMDADAGGARRHRFRVPVVSTLAAAVVLVFTALAAYGAAPNEALWPVTEVLYSQHAASIQAADDAGTAQAQAEAAMAAGHTHEAEAALDAAASRLPQVRSQDGQTNLQNRQRDLERQLNTPAGPAAKTPSASAPGPPPRSARTSASPKPTSHSLRSESPTARAKESSRLRRPNRVRDDDYAANAPNPCAHFGEPDVTTGIASSPASHHGRPGPPPHRQRDQLQAPRGRTARQHQPAHQGSYRSNPATRRPRSPRHSRRRKRRRPLSTGQAVEPSSSVRTAGNRQRQAAAKQTDSPAPTPRPSPDSTPS